MPLISANDTLLYSKLIVCKASLRDAGAHSSSRCGGSEAGYGYTHPYYISTLIAGDKTAGGAVYLHINTGISE